MNHVESVDCPCLPQRRRALGGGQVMVHRIGHEQQGRETPSTRPLDRHCQLCSRWHMFDHPHLERMHAIGTDFRDRLRLGNVPDGEDPASLTRTVTFLAGRA